MSDLDKAILNATNTEEISAILHAEHDAQEKSVRELRATKVEPEPTTLTCSETINGKVFTFEAESQGELDSMVANAYRVAYAMHQEPEQFQETVEPVDPAKEAAARAELEVQFRSGAISAKDYLEKSGAVAEYLEKEGVPVDALRATVDQNQQREFTQSWAEATQAFLNSPAGADWPGGTKNVNLIGMTIAKLGLTDAEDKIGALAQAYQDMKVNGLIFADQPESTESSRTAHTAQSEPVRYQQSAQAATVEYREPPRQSTQWRTSSGIFGASSGTSANDMRDTSKDTPQFKIDSNASPQEIIDAWKQAQIKQGIDPNAAFTQQFSGKK